MVRLRIAMPPSKPIFCSIHCVPTTQNCHWSRVLSYYYTQIILYYYIERQVSCMIYSSNQFFFTYILLHIHVYILLLLFLPRFKNDPPASRPSRHATVIRSSSYCLHGDNIILAKSKPVRVVYNIIYLSVGQVIHLTFYTTRIATRRNGIDLVIFDFISP